MHLISRIGLPLCRSSYWTRKWYVSNTYLVNFWDWIVTKVFKGWRMGPQLVLVSPCFRENVFVTCKSVSFLLSLDNLLQKNAIVVFLEIKFHNGAHLKKRLFLTYFSQFLVTRESYKKSDRTHTHTPTHPTHTPTQIWCRHCFWWRFHEKAQETYQVILLHLGLCELKIMFVQENTTDVCTRFQRRG